MTRDRLNRMASKLYEIADELREEAKTAEDEIKIDATVQISEFLQDFWDDVLAPYAGRKKK